MMKIETTRRKALAIFGFGAASAPLAAKQLAEDAAAQLAGVNLKATNSYAIGGPSPVSGDDYNTTLDKASEFFEIFGPPKHIQEQLDRNANYCNSIDPDIASKRSWSLAVKIATQRERNKVRQHEGLRDAIRSRKARKAFRAVTGYDWPYYT